MESLNSSLEGKIGHNEANQKKNRNIIFLGENPKHFPPPHSCSSLTGCCGHHTPDSLLFRPLIEMNPWTELRDLPLSCSAFGGGSGDGEAWMGSRGCQAWLCTAKDNVTCEPWSAVTSCALPVTQSGVTWFSFHWAMTNQYGYKEILRIIFCFSVSNNLLRVEIVNGLCPRRERVNTTETD